ncbi:hypothetical protein Q8A67_025671 [Cirrhinus molitorella]|uniref:Uncharacterized protein n=1 Tax=Cirrhinus molitorella TaxID=172907 RepID=A0AA88TBP9_9TELE|nr:hypothetical protein Q8A67_025671 [Cirrhinus molitorella]
MSPGEQDSLWRKPTMPTEEDGERNVHLLRLMGRDWPGLTHLNTPFPAGTAGGGRVGGTCPSTPDSSLLTLVWREPSFHKRRGSPAEEVIRVAGLSDHGGPERRPQTGQLDASRTVTLSEKVFSPSAKTFVSPSAGREGPRASSESTVVTDAGREGETDPERVTFLTAPPQMSVSAAVSASLAPRQ